MKRKLMMMSIVAFMWSAAWGEIIQTVGYNPARFGEYKRLKVTSGMETEGAVVTPELEGSGKEITLTACESGNCAESAYKVSEIQSAKAEVTSGTMTIKKVEGTGGSVKVGNGSEIKDAIKAGEVAVKQLSAGSSSVTVTDSLTLGENRIPRPEYTNCQWKWETIQHKDGTAKVLALAGCDGVEDDWEEDAPCYDREYFKAHKAECCAKVDDPESSLGADYCYLRKYTWVKHTKSGLAGEELGPSWRANNLGCLYPSEPVYPYRSGGSLCASSAKEGAECVRSSSDTFCYLGIYGDEWWKQEGVSLEKLDPSSSYGDTPNSLCRCWGGYGLNVYECGAKSYFCECRVNSWPILRCEESFVKNGW